MRKFILIGSVILVVVLLILTKTNALVIKKAAKPNNIPSSLSFPNGNKIFIEIAATPKKMELGLSGKAALEKNRGMLFIFSKEGFPPFWMKDMNFSIDIIWLDRNFSIADITKSISPATFPQTFAPQKPAQYVLEVSAGVAEENNLRTDDIIKTRF